MATDWTRIVDNILPDAGAEDTLRMRTGTIDVLNSDGTADVVVSGIVVPDLPVVDGAVVVSGDTVMLISYRGQLIVLGRARSRVMDTPYVTSGIGTIESGWTLNYQRGQIRGGVAFVGIEFVRTGGTITVPADGNITNTLVFQLNAAWRQPTAGANLSPGLSSTATGRMCAATITAAGIISLSATTPGSNIVDGNALSLYGSWPVA